MGIAENGLEVSVDPLSRFWSGDEPQRRAMERIAWTCAIESCKGSFGSGVLIGPDKVLTNFHVVQRLLAEPERYREASCRFDFGSDIGAPREAAGHRAGFAADWPVVLSRFSEKDESGTDTGFEPDKLDFAIIKLDRSIGFEPLATDAGGAMRGWLTIPLERERPVVPGTPLQIWQHPVERRMLGASYRAMPLKWSSGKVLSLIDTDLRLRHDAMTFKGSSGAACYDMNFNFIALHHAGDPDADIDFRGKWNQAIPVAAIVRHLTATGHGGLLGVVPPRATAAPRISRATREIRVARDMAEGRLQAAAILMDRDEAERDLCYLRRPSSQDRGMLHVLSCRHVDHHGKFLRRIARWSLVRDEKDLRAQREGMAAFLNPLPKDRPDETWTFANLTWPRADRKLPIALDMLRRDLEVIASETRPQLVEAVVEIRNVDLRREKVLVREIAKLAGSLSNPDRLQIFVIYYDQLAKGAPDPNQKLRAALGALWKIDERPPGAGLCLCLDDISSVELGAWCRALETAWQLPEGELKADVDKALATRQLPMMDAEKRLMPVLRSWLDGQSGG
ncbi:trypsin-like serine peptidase [Ancylobacter amanitiformis]|uniref:Serine protease n=1 Tax=Ancylobacter amanitiformis TaxID=217069 RepID=A0ABU0LU07_9HYPH|nr:serine protease [Ancylobacter amanitiformis]MDQ0512163.1 hypothetical protein [Ancylobacter amanitiformis]